MNLSSDLLQNGSLKHPKRSEFSFASGTVAIMFAFEFHLMFFKEEKNTKESFQSGILFLEVLKFANLMVWDLAVKTSVSP